jgi:NodT family efflux transporter outer membrane factor (OMF) lipoprotein
VTDRWWENYGDPQLNALVERASLRNPTLAEALARLERARAEATAAAGTLSPQVNASASVLRERYSARYVIPPPYGGATVWDGQLSLGLSWDLDFWGRQRDLVHAGDARVQAAALDARAAQLALQAALVTTYLEYDRNQALVDLGSQFQANRARLAELTARRVTAGLDANAELQNASAPVPEARLELKKSLARVELLRHQLAALSGQGAEAYAAIGPPALDGAATLALPEDLPADLLLRRPDIQAALAWVRAADSGAEAARLARYPDLQLAAFAGTAGIGLGDLLSAPARTLGVGPKLLLPVFDAGVLRARYQAAGAELNAAVAAYDEAVLSAVRETADQIGLLHALVAEHRDAEQELVHLSAAYRLVSERRQAGLSGEQAVLEAESRLLTARASLVTTRALEDESRVALLVALGGGVPVAGPGSPPGSTAPSAKVPPL